MPVRPGDSAPNFDKIEAHLNSDEETAGAAPPAPPRREEPGLPDSHVFQMPMMVPHFSDGSTDVIQRGRDTEDTIVVEPTGALFSAQSEAFAAARHAADDLESTQQLERVVRTETFAAPPAPVVAAPQTKRPSPPMDRPAPAAPPASMTSPTPAAKSGSGLLTVLLLSYASAVTIGLIYLLMNRGESASPDQNQLESLRDPIDEQGTVRIYQRGVELPPGHRLELAQSQRFGNILVEPTRVTRGALTFEHYTKNARQKQSPSPPVLKLWLKLTNVSQDQQIAPFDALLMFKRELNAAGALVSNTYVSPRGQAEQGPVVFTYPLAQNSEWDLVGQNLGHTLAPGESLETFIPSDVEGLDTLSGELEWRFHLRKGYAPTQRGVTTLVEVAFNSSRIEDEPAPIAPATPTDLKTKKKS